MAKWGDGTMALGGVLVGLAGLLWPAGYREIAQWLAISGVAVFGLGLILRLSARNGHSVEVRESRSQSRRDGDGDQFQAGRDLNIHYPDSRAPSEAADVKPRLKLEYFQVKSVRLTARSGNVLEWDVLSMVFRNAQVAWARTASAREVFPEFTCTGFAAPLPWVVARDDYAPQPIEIARGGRPNLVFDVPVGQWKEISLIVRNPETGLCFLFGNDFFAPVNCRIPESGMGSGTYTLHVRLNCEGMEEQLFECQFTNGGPSGSITLGEFRQMTSID